MSPSVRRRTAVPGAAPAAASAPSEEQIAVALTALSDPSPSVRRTVAKLLGGQREGRATGALIAALSDPEAAVRASVARSLGEIGRPEGRGPLERLLHDSDPRVREQVAFALGRLGRAESAPALVALARDPAEEVRTAVFAALGRLSPPSARTTIEGGLTDPSDRVRREAVLALSYQADPAIVERVRPMLDDPARRVRTAAAVVLGRYRDARSVPRLLERLSGSDHWEHPSVLVALGKIGDARAAPALAAKAEEPAPYLRVCAIHALGEMKSERAREVALRHVADRSWAVRGASAVCLGQVGTPADLPALLGLLEDPHPWPRSGAIYAIGRLDLGEAAARVRAELHHPVADVRLAAVWTLGRLRDDGARRELVRLLGDPDAPSEAPALLAEGDGAIRISSDAETRIFDTVVEALGRLRHPDDDAYVEQALRDARAQLSEEELDRFARLPTLVATAAEPPRTLRALFEAALPFGEPSELS